MFLWITGAWILTMHILSLMIKRFRGIQEANLVLPQHVAIVGPNGSGKSTLVDSLSLVFGRNKLVRDLTEHDFYGSCPDSASRIQIVVTLGGFSSDNPEDFPHWFRHGRAIPKWWEPTTRKVRSTPNGKEQQLCVQIGYAARFDLEELYVDQIRYFHDDDEVTDPFIEEAVTLFPRKMLNEIGFYVIPSRRTWPSTISFGSELFRKAVTTFGGLPAETILEYRDSLRSPKNPLETAEALRPLVDRINTRLAQLMPGKPKLQLRLTSTDSESLLRALVPHYELDDGNSLPAGRHGTGLISLQTLVLLLEIGRARIERGESFILALEEPELHVPPGLQRRLIGEAVALANQTVCTTHAPRVAAFFDAQSILLLTKKKRFIEDKTSMEGESAPVEKLEAKALATSSMIDAKNAIIQLYTDKRIQLVEALMFPKILIPEGRIDFEWLRLMCDIAETGEHPLHLQTSDIPPIGAVVGVVPTRDSHVKVTFEQIRSLRDGIFVVVDGDGAGDRYIMELKGCTPAPFAILQWPKGWAIEDVIKWTIEVDSDKVLSEVHQRIDRGFESLEDLIAALKSDDGRSGGLKQHYIVHEEIAGAIKTSAKCVQRVELVLDAVTRTALEYHVGFEHLEADNSRSSDYCKIYRFQS
jgi:energy-coupling factor transporter ATP-binding protein EcfA2